MGLYHCQCLDQDSQRSDRGQNTMFVQGPENDRPVVYSSSSLKRAGANR